MEIDFEKLGGLVPAIIQDAVTKNVLMLGFMNQEAYDKTIATKKVTFWSRSRNCLWTKGETSGNFLNLVSIQNDCDNDTLLVKVHPDGPTCHKGTDTCWAEENTLNPILFLSELQDFQLLHDRTVRKNFEFVLKATGWKNKKDRDKRIEEVLNEVGMIDKIDKMPHELSGGEQQRVAIARAILNNPKIIIADEPTGNLDPETASNIVSLLKDITKQGTAVVMTTHNIPMLDKFPGIVYRCKEGVLYDVTNEYNRIDLTEDGEDN